MSEDEKNGMIVLVAALAAVGLTALFSCALVRVSELWPAVGRFFVFCGACLLFLGLGIAAWESGRRFQAEHGSRKCGCRSEDEED